MYISGEIQLMVFSACTLGLSFALILWTNSRIDALQKKIRGFFIACEYLDCPCHKDNGSKTLYDSKHQKGILHKRQTTIDQLRELGYDVLDRATGEVIPTRFDKRKED
jgi:hypothetical protein